MSIENIAKVKSPGILLKNCCYTESRGISNAPVLKSFTTSSYNFNKIMKTKNAPTHLHKEDVTEAFFANCCIDYR